MSRSTRESPQRLAIGDMQNASAAMWVEEGPRAGGWPCLHRVTLRPLSRPPSSDFHSFHQLLGTVTGPPHLYPARHSKADVGLQTLSVASAAFEVSNLAAQKRPFLPSVPRCQNSRQWLCQQARSAARSKSGVAHHPPPPPPSQMEPSPILAWTPANVAGWASGAVSCGDRPWRGRGGDLCQRE